MIAAPGKLAGLMALMLCGAANAQSGWLTTKYLATRNAAIFKITRDDSIGDNGAKSTTQEQSAALLGLQQQLQQILGPLAIAGFPAAGVINLTELDPTDIDFGNLDGLQYTSNDGATRLVVTSDELLSNWLVENQDERTVPAEFDAAVKSENFYSYASFNNAVVYGFGEIPLLVKPKHFYPTPANPQPPTAFAMLAVRAQDDGATRPNEIILSLHQAGLLYIFEQKLTVMIPVFQGCNALYRTGAPADETAGYIVLRRCYAASIKKDPSFVAVTAQAQTLAGILQPGPKARVGTARSRI